MPDKENKKKILVVDDEQVNIDVILAILEKDYQIIQANSGKEALLKIESEIPDIVLLDIMMPEMSGYEVCAKIKQQETTRFMPVVIITSLYDIEYKVKAIESGADDFLTKPVNSLEIATRVRSLLRSKSFHDQLIASLEKIKAQDEFKTVMADLIPFMLNSIPEDDKMEVIKEMSKRVEEIISKKYEYGSPIGMKKAVGISCSIMNRMGGSFSIETAGKNTYYVKSSQCPWGEAGKISPVLCMLTRSIFTRIGMKAREDISIEISKTIAGGDGYCQLEINSVNSPHV